MVRRDPSGDESADREGALVSRDVPELRAVQPPSMGKVVELPVVGGAKVEVCPAGESRSHCVAAEALASAASVPATAELHVGLCRRGDIMPQHDRALP